MTDPRTLAIEPLTKASFTPFGVVIERDGAEIRMINEGTTTYCKIIKSKNHHWRLYFYASTI